VAGATYSFGAGYYNAWVLKLDVSGNITGCFAEGSSNATVNTTNVSGANSSVTPAGTSVNLGISASTINNTNISPAQVCYTYTLTVTKSGTGSGTVTSDLGGINCGDICSANFNPDASVNLFAKAEIGSFFYGWPGDYAICGANSNCNGTMSSDRNCTATFIRGVPSEASKSSSPMIATKGSGTSVNVSYTPSNCAIDHSVYWGQSPISGNLSWINGECGLGMNGTASFDPRNPPSGYFYYFVIVGNYEVVEGSYGRNSSSVERPEAIGIPGCDIEQNLVGACE